VVIIKRSRSNHESGLMKVVCQDSWFTTELVKEVNGRGTGIVRPRALRVLLARERVNRLLSVQLLNTGNVVSVIILLETTTMDTGQAWTIR